jgi:hypothetical protein
MSARAIVLGSLLSAFAASGCAYGEVRQVVRAQFASELNCPEVTVKKRDAWYGYESPNQWKVSGCGVMRTYTCPKTEGRISYDEPACTWVEGDADAPKVGGNKSGDAMDESEHLDGEEPVEDEGDGDAAPADKSDDEPSDDLDDDSSDSGGGGGDDADDGESSAPKPAAKGKVSASGGFKLGGKKK